MKKSFTCLIFLLFSAVLAIGQSEVVPPAYTTTSGNGSFTGPLSSNGRTYQLMIHQDMLLNLVGKELTGISFRASSGGSGSWPAADATVTNYDVFIGPGVAPANRDLVLISNNAAGPQTQVRSGPITFVAGSYPSGSTPNAFGPPISFNTPYLYSGGHLLVEIRHSGAGSNRSVNALTSSASGSGTMFNAAWAGVYAGATTGTNGNFAVTQFTYQTPLSIQLIAFKASMKGKDAVLNWATASEENNDHFIIERSFNGKDFTSIGKLQAQPANSSIQHYEYKDLNAGSLNVLEVFYRFQAVDKTGQASYSSIASVRLSGESAIAHLFPNPVTSAPTLALSLPEADNISFDILDVTGKSVKSGTFYASSSANITIDMASLSSGVYTLVLSGKALDERIRFIK